LDTSSARKSFALKTGEFTEPIRTRQGFIILRVVDHIQAGTPPFDAIREQIQEQLYSQKIQPALREYLTHLREDAYVDVKPGYTDTGASPNQTKLVYTSDTGPKTKQVRGKLGVGKKKTVIVAGRRTKGKPVGSTSGLGTAKAEVDAKTKAENDRKANEAKAAAKAAADAAEKEKMSHMSDKEKRQYLAQKKRAAKKEAKLESKETKQEKRQAKKDAKRKADEAKAAKNGKQPAAKPADANAKPADQQADASAPPKKKKSISWF